MVKILGVIRFYPTALTDVIIQKGFSPGLGKSIEDVIQEQGSNEAVNKAYSVYVKPFQ